MKNYYCTVRLKFLSIITFWRELGSSPKLLRTCCSVTCACWTQIRSNIPDDSGA